MNKWSRVGCVLLLAGALYCTGTGPGHGLGTASIPLRLFGPVSSLAAGWQWVRVRMALDARRPNLAYSRAELALELDPRATTAWSFLGAHMANDRGSPFRQADPRQRTRWTEAALELLQRGEAQARRPAQLALQCGSILVRVGEYEGAVPWPGGSAGAFRDAEGHFERATRLDPGSTEAWTLLAAHRTLWLGSPAMVSTSEARIAALRSALATLDQAEAQLDDLGGIHFQRGVLLGLFADDAEREDVNLWPGGRAALYRAAVEAFRAAEQEGFPIGAEARRSAEEALRQVQGT